MLLTNHRTKEKFDRGYYRAVFSHVSLNAHNKKEGIQFFRVSH